MMTLSEIQYIVSVISINKLAMPLNSALCQTQCMDLPSWEGFVANLTPCNVNFNTMRTLASFMLIAKNFSNHQNATSHFWVGREEYTSNLINLMLHTQNER